MASTFKLIIALIFTSYHFNFVLSQFYSEPKIIYRPRKSGTRPRSFKINWPRKAFKINDRKAFEVSDIYTENFLKEIESRIQPKGLSNSGARQWQAAVETRPRKNEKFLETDQKSRQKKNFDMLHTEEVSLNSEETTKQQKISQKELLRLKEEIRKEKQNKKDRKKKEESLSIELSEQINPKEYPISSQTAVVEKNNLRGGHHSSVLVSRQLNHKDSKHNNHCVKKCYAPKCEVECIGRQGSAACSANKCKARTRGPDSAAVCKGDKCQGLCFKAECIAACEGDSCSVKCEGNICHAVAEGRRAESACEGEFCVAYGKGPGTRPKCEGKLCQTWCVGDNCVAKCHGYNCEAMCNGRQCIAQCEGKNCSQYHYPDEPESEKPWALDSKSKDSKSEEISISNESGHDSNLATKPNKYDDDDDGYYGNKHHVQNTINNEFSSIDNKGYFGYSGNSGNVPYLPVPFDNKEGGDVTLDYSIAVQLSKRIGDYLKKKITDLKDSTLLRYFPSFI